MLGKTNISGGLKEYDLVCFYWGQRSAADSGVATANIQYAYNNELVSFNSSTQKFTVLKDFDSNVNAIGNGARNGTAGNSGRYPLTIYFKVNSTTVITGTINENGSTTPAVTTRSFKTGDVFWVEGSHGINSYAVDIGFILDIAKI